MIASRVFFSRPPLHGIEFISAASEEVIGNQESILANQREILANQKKILHK
jgi:hypothetical protein